MVINHVYVEASSIEFVHRSHRYKCDIFCIHSVGQQTSNMTSTIWWLSKGYCLLIFWIYIGSYKILCKVWYSTKNASKMLLYIGRKSQKCADANSCLFPISVRQFFFPIEYEVRWNATTAHKTVNIDRTYEFVI